MSNLDTTPAVTPCHAGAGPGAVTELLEPREVPLGGLRAMRVQRLLPQRARPTVGAWCFLDEFGPQRLDMSVLPHPHIGLQTVTWPLAGEIRHRDTVGSDAVLRPGQLNLMTAGHGIAHSEFSVGADSVLHALQLWVALPAGKADVAPHFEQHVQLPRYTGDGVSAVVFMGALGETVSPATTYTPLVGAEVTLEPGGGALPLRPDFEHAVLVIDGSVTIDGVELAAGPLLYLGLDRAKLEIGSADGARLVLLGGEPFPDDLVMWWNFVGRTHEDIAAAREAWEAPDPVRFGVIPAHNGERIPAPVLPTVRLTPRRSRR
ncbi:MULTISPECIES: pirin family protein [unclassified Crossiella]|uniref:pirin family protein n=1 Tax=unclassified Crossiella TaxID=2620835 RepID=UPI001FFEFA44|nr:MULTISPECIES: pirin family protein [unclassified Crossiella]MCK2241932.1 pirin family protein [Crossiella sp. S99.2]MCK2255835.1 pirin family protein [Crossiella sp. S99.1]